MACSNVLFSRSNGRCRFLGTPESISRVAGLLSRELQNVAPSNSLYSKDPNNHTPADLPYSLPDPTPY